MQLSQSAVPGRRFLGAIGVLAVVAMLVVVGHQVGTGAEHPDVMLPAEWERHEAVWLSFFGGELDSVSMAIAARISSHTEVKAVVSTNGEPGNAAVYRLQAELKARGAHVENISIVPAERNVQVRDVGPIFVRDGAGLRVVNFGWNDYGSGTRGDDYPFDEMMAARFGFEVIDSPLVMEGGAIESNGKGTILQVESVTLQRNPGWAKTEIEAELARTVGAKQVIWLEEGPAEDPYGLSMIADGHVGLGIGGHVDEFARFVDPHTVLLAFPDSAQAAADPVMAMTRSRMERNLQILSEAVDQDGRPIEVVKVPVPNAPYPEMIVDSSWERPPFRAILDRNPAIVPGDTLHWVPTRSYLNFFVTNHEVFVPAYWKPGLPDDVLAADRRFQEVMRSFYPDREIVPLDPRELNDNAGGIHCWTQQQPA